jgi:hypothetical protein
MKVTMNAYAVTVEPHVLDRIEHRLHGCGSARQFR